ncbi:thiamine pyrophosphate-binding protein [Streptomyces albipurpureus]|uniref:Thiamine pyrophosphate-binding protein n=1 Tax=Streptomyces albipurpureus TaxID=2897419 RepID=A0ABT0UPU6_9ACTN|nr:thiamine pyrophosphate-binding protein [Streptomyces sp. CWNU-1]MCM2390628.1 thiamine pyrophosphate-binding protein [Streptomyces sp. CWNU-1]
MSYGDGGDLLVTVLREQGAEVVFGVVSVHNMPLVEAVDRELRFVPVRHEAAAVSAADAYARVTGGLGTALTSTGTGCGNAAGALIEAQSGGAAVLHVTGQIDSGFLGLSRGVIHETRDQTGLLRAVSKHAVTVRPGADAGALLRDAAARARTPPRGPISVEWPIDLQYAAQPLTGPGAQIGIPSAPDSTQLAAAAQLLGTARRPVIWAGGGARGASEPLRNLVERLGAPVLSSNAGRGVLAEDHPQVVGNFAASATGRELLATADLLLSVGTHFRSNETGDYSLPIPAHHVQIDIDATAIGRVFPAEAGVVGAAEPVLTALLGLLEDGSVEPGWREFGIAAAARARAELRTAIGPYSLICDALRSRFPRESVIARDVTIASSQWGNRLLEMYAPSTNLFPLGGGIGQGLAMGIGGALARPNTPTLVIAGDGGLAVHLGELGTLAQEHPWLVLCVFNDGGYGVLRNMQDAHRDRRSGVDLATPDFAELAAAYRLPFQRVTAAADFPEALDKGLATRGPCVIEIDVNAVGPTPIPFTPPVTIPGS